jgi:hypothetical protein
MNFIWSKKDELYNYFICLTFTISSDTKKTSDTSDTRLYTYHCPFLKKQSLFLPAGLSPAGRK